MPVSVNRVKVGDRLWSSSMQKMGNTTMSRRAYFPVVVKEIAPDLSYFIISWNGNKPHKVFPKNGKLPYSRTRPDSV